MDINDTYIKDTTVGKLVSNDYYFKNIFKKTEKIVSVVFYIVQNSDIDKKSETHSSNLISKAHFAHENALRTLEVKPASAREVLEQFAQSLIGVDSTLRVVTAAGLLTTEVQQVVSDELLTVLRTLQQFMEESIGSTGAGFMASLEVSDDSTPSRRVRSVPRGVSRSVQTATANVVTKAVRPPSSSSTSPPTNADRRTRIQTIIEAKGEATIKDISDIITDISEKTIQRELNAMISDRLIQRHGERRWSRYSLV